ncbi:MAG TPA: SMP-30/gluconolactonase/LRE family protein [Parafilimonas sp.]|nr:SMP-30/gluconolactonase/LRE family protein [Parafilimonas sp.]
MRKIFFVTLALCLFFIKGKTQVVANNARLILIDSNFSFTEGASCDKAGNVFFTDQPNNTIWEYDINNKLSIWLKPAKRSNGTYFDEKGNLISCADENNELISISPTKKIAVLINNYRGNVLNGPNDVWVNRVTGGMYITDPYFQRDYWTRQQPDSNLHGEKLYYLPPNKNMLAMADSAVKKPNGIVGTADGKYLYVADMGVWKTYRYEIQNDGSLKNKTLFVNEASDGMTIDDKGNIYITGNGVTVYNSSGEKIDHIDVPEKWTANLCFGGKHKDMLFITASKSLYKIQTLVKGIE